jgi:hypothetical protein
MKSYACRLPVWRKPFSRLAGALSFSEVTQPAWRESHAVCYSTLAIRAATSARDRAPNLSRMCRT